MARSGAGSRPNANAAQDIFSRGHLPEDSVFPLQTFANCAQNVRSRFGQRSGFGEGPNDSIPDFEPLLRHLSVGYVFGDSDNPINFTRFVADRERTVVNPPVAAI